jgi:excisionase family DNA binding protein
MGSLEILRTRLWDAGDVAKFLKASRNWVYQQAELGKIPSVRIGGLRRFDPEKIKALVLGDQPAVVLPRRR